MIVFARALPLIVIALVRAEALTTFVAESIVTGEVAASVKVKVVPPRSVVYSLPVESIMLRVLSFAFLRVSEPFPVVKITSEPLRVVLESAELREILSSAE